MRILTCLALFLAGVSLVCAASPPAKSTQYGVTGGAVVVPYYGATYGTPGGFSQADAKRMLELQEATLEAQRQSLDEQRLTNEYLRALATKQGAPIPQAALKKPVDLLTVAKKHCAECHTPAKAKGDFILFADDAGSALKPLSANEKKRIVDEVRSGLMPKGRPPMSAEEKSAFRW